MDTDGPMLRETAPVLFLGLALAGCIIPPTSAMRLTESAYDLNTAARFGRMDVALENVRDTARDEFTQRHASWGRAVRIVDYEFGGVGMRKDGDADVTVTVLWQHPDETTMRSTDLSQRWTEKRGTWYLLSEQESGGDHGLLLDAPKKPKTEGAKAEGSKGEAAKAETAKADAPAPAAADTATEQGAAPPAAPQSQRQRYQTRVIYEQ
jgi:hypothetical protein